MDRAGTLRGGEMTNMQHWKMAGAEGFEPTHARIKTWCLNRLATPLH